MTSQVIFKIDKKIKEMAQKKAKARGLTFSDVLKMATYQYVEGGFEPTLVAQEKLKPSVRRSLIKQIQDIKKGKNISSTFTNAKDMIAYLEAHM